MKYPIHVRTIMVEILKETFTSTSLLGPVINTQTIHPSTFITCTHVHMYM